MKPIILRQHEVIHLRDTGSVIAWRVVKPQRHPFGHILSVDEVAKEVAGETCAARCPYGRTGEERWVKETFFHEPADYCWQASVSIPSRPEVTVYRADYTGDSRHCGWKSSQAMPQELSRFTVTLDVGLKRIQEVTEEEAMASVKCSEFTGKPYCTNCSGHQSLCHKMTLRQTIAKGDENYFTSNPSYFWTITCTLKK